MQDRELNFVSPVSDMQLCSVVRVSKTRVDGKTLKIKRHRVKALWDTGAVTSAISRSLADILGLKVREHTVLQTASGSVRVAKDLVLLDLMLDDTVIPVMAAVVDSVPGKNIDFLIGMDVIMCGSLSVDTVPHEGNFHVSFIPYPGLFKNIQEFC